jgi:hypothetical protein
MRTVSARMIGPAHHSDAVTPVCLDQTGSTSASAWGIEGGNNMKKTYRHTYHESRRNDDALLCQQAPRMVVSGVCPHCGKSARHDYYGLTCLTCGWAQYA